MLNPPSEAAPATVPVETRDSCEAGSSVCRSPPAGFVGPGVRLPHGLSPKNRRTQHTSMYTETDRQKSKPC